MLVNIGKLSNEIQKYFVKLNRSIVNLEVDAYNAIVIDRAFHILFKLKKMDAFPKFCELNNQMAFRNDRDSAAKETSVDVNPYQGYVTKDSRCYSHIS